MFIDKALPKMLVTKCFHNQRGELSYSQIKTVNEKKDNTTTLFRAIYRRNCLHVEVFYFHGKCWFVTGQCLMKRQCCVYSSYIEFMTITRERLELSILQGLKYTFITAEKRLTIGLSLFSAKMFPVWNVISGKYYSICWNRLIHYGTLWLNA